MLFNRFIYFLNLMEENMMRKILISAILMSSVASAQADDKFKMGVEGGFALADLGAEDVAQALANSTGRTVTYTEEQGTPYFRIYGAYELSDQFDIEVGYFNAASLDSTYSFSGSTVTAGVGVKVSGWDVGGRFNVNENVFLKAGMHNSEMEGTVSVTISGTTYSASASQDGTGAYFGGGYNFNENLSVGFTHLSSLAGDSDSDANLIYVGYQF